MPDPIAELLAGFRRFRRRWFENRPALYAGLAHGQRPHTMVVACSDSRVDPALLADSRPGDLFVVRNVANLVPPCIGDVRHHGTSAALEFAVRALRVQNVIVLGHSQCGGIQALFEGAWDDFTFVQPWMDIARGACQLAMDLTHGQEPKQRTRAAERAGIVQSLANLDTFPWVRDAVQQRRLRLHGWHFDLEQGELWGYDPAGRQFLPLHPPAADAEGERTAAAP